jgi:hypothetical protein
MVKKRAWNRTPLDDEKIKHMYLTKRMSAKDVAAALRIEPGPIYRRLRELGITRSNSDSHKGITPANFKGRFVERRSGYIMLAIEPTHRFACMGSKYPTSRRLYVREHRMIMAEHLGRALRRNEVVHHRNGKRGDNRMRNLELIQGQAHHNGHTIAQKHWDAIMKIVEKCPRCLAAISATDAAEQEQGI